FDYVLEQSGIERASLAPEDVRLLLDHARDAKEALSSAPEARIDVTLSNGKTLSVALDEARFEALTQTLVQRTLTPTKK
ncbi:Hsp70 family protein, partial [Paraburkholderia sp. SIMBA_049]